MQFCSLFKLFDNQDCSVRTSEFAVTIPSPRVRIFVVNRGHCRNALRRAVHRRSGQRRRQGRRNRHLQNERLGYNPKIHGISYWTPRPSPEGSLENPPRKNVCKMIRRFETVLLFIYQLKRAWRVLSGSGFLVYEKSKLTLSFGPLP